MKDIEIFPGVYKIDGKLATLNSVKGFKVYDEKLIHKSGNEYRIWDPFRSKLAAAILKGLKNFPFNNKSNVLYLGASAGTTPSHIADITVGLIYCVEFSQRMMRELLLVCEKKKNMIPILGDARHPREYYHNIGPVDVIYQDVAQPNQAEILLNNTEYFNPKFAILSIKSRSINSVKSPKQIFREEIDKLKDRFNILETIDLNPYDKDHVVVNMKIR